MHVLRKYTNCTQIRSHAAGALSNLQQRDLCEGVWVRALQTVCDAAAELQGNGGVLSKSSAESGMRFDTQNSS